jgi:hypothetical protein
MSQHLDLDANLAGSVRAFRAVVLQRSRGQVRGPELAQQGGDRAVDHLRFHPGTDQESGRKAVTDGK